MTAKDVMHAASDAAPGERLRRYEAICGSRGACRCEPLANDPGRWAWCADCFAVHDDYGSPVNPIPEFAKVH